MKFQIPSDHPINKEAKVGDMVTVSAKVLSADDGLEIEVDKVELVEPSKAKPKKSASSPVDYIRQVRNRAKAAA